MWAPEALGGAAVKSATLWCLRPGSLQDTPFGPLTRRDGMPEASHSQPSDMSNRGEQQIVCLITPSYPPTHLPTYPPNPPTHQRRLSNLSGPTA